MLKDDEDDDEEIIEPIDTKDSGVYVVCFFDADTVRPG